MARLLVDAVSHETSADTHFAIETFVSVSRADTGMSVTGLTKDNFRVTFFIGGSVDPTLTVSETKWEPDDVELAGCYHLTVFFPDTVDWVNVGQRWPLGIQVRTFGRLGGGNEPGDFGQTVLYLQSLGE